MTTSWQNRSPGDLRVELPMVHPTPVEPCIATAARVAPTWARASRESRAERLRAVQADLKAATPALATALALEVGKTIGDARAELESVVAKFDLTLADATDHLTPRVVAGAVNEAEVRQLAQGPAAIIGPFNVPLHLPNGAICAHLAAGNPVLFKPSPFAANVAADYVAIFQRHLPPGVIQLVQGAKDESVALCEDPRVRAICFTGSVTVGRALAQAIAHDFSKTIALELGGKNALIVCEDADIGRAARAAADGMCLTTGQRCNGTSRVLVRSEVAEDFLAALQKEVALYEPGHPLRPETKLGPLVSAASQTRFAEAIASTTDGEWVMRGQKVESVGEFPGHYVRPAVLLWRKATAGLRSPFISRELFAPLLEVCVVRDDEETLRLHDATPYGLTASIFTASRARFEALGARLAVGNLYANLATTASISTLPFPGRGDSGNGRPAGRGFVRFVTQEQSVQVAAGTLR